MKHLIWIILLLVASCGKKETIVKSTISNEKQTFTIKAEDEAIQRALNEQNLYCNEKSCPENIIKIITKEYERDGEVTFAQCTGTLINEDTVITNAHCVPKRCDHFYAISPTLKNSNNKFYSQCRSIISTADRFKDRHGDLDYGIVKLQDKFQVKTLKINADGIDNNTKISAYVINHHDDGLGGEIVNKTCKTTFQPIQLFSYEHKYTPVVFLDGCDIISGNSGSAIYNKNKEIIGLISHRFKLDTEVSNGLATNLHCMDNSYNPKRSKMSKRCLLTENELEDIAIYNRFSTKIDKYLAELNSDNTFSIFKWGIFNTRFENEDDFLVPVCIKKGMKKLLTNDVLEIETAGISENVGVDLDKSFDGSKYDIKKISSLKLTFKDLKRKSQKDFSEIEFEKSTGNNSVKRLFECPND